MSDTKIYTPRSELPYLSGYGGGEPTVEAAPLAPGERPIISTPVSGAPFPELREAASGFFRDVRSSRELTVDARVDRVLAQYEGLSAPLLDMDQTAAIMAMTGFDALKGSEGRSVRFKKAQWEDRAKSAVEVAAQEAACMGAANGDGKLTKENIALLKKRYGADMQTSKFADSTVGGIGRGAIGAGIGFFGGGFAAFTASMASGKGFFKSCFLGVAGSIAGLFGGTMIHKLADKAKEATGFGFGLASDNHMSKFEQAMKEAAKAGHEVANEYDIEVIKMRKGRAVGAGESRRLSVAEIAERNAEEAAAGRGVAAGAAGATVAAAAAASATTSSTTTAKSTAPAESVAPEERIVIAKDSVLAALAGKDKEMIALLNGTATEKSLEKMSLKERKDMVSEMYLNGDIARADIMSDVIHGRYDAAKTKAVAFAKTLAPAAVESAPVMDDRIKAMVDAAVEQRLAELAAKGAALAAGAVTPVAPEMAAPKVEPITAKAAETATPKLELATGDKAFLKSLGISGEDARPVEGAAKEKKAPAAMDVPEALAGGGRATDRMSAEEQAALKAALTKGKEVKSAVAEKAEAKVLNPLAAEFGAKWKEEQEKLGITESGGAIKGTLVIASSTPAPAASKGEIVLAKG
jgi:hypothetical protein